MSTIPGLTCTRCDGPLYPDTARRTDDGWHHATTARARCRMNQKARAEAERRAAILEDVEFMAETGESFTRAAHRVGMSIAALEGFLRRNQRTDLLHTLTAREAGSIHARRKAA